MTPTAPSRRRTPLLPTDFGKRMLQYEKDLLQAALGELSDFGVGWVVSPERVVAELEVYEEHRTGLLAMLAQRGITVPSRDT